MSFLSGNIIKIERANTSENVVSCCEIGAAYTNTESKLIGIRCNSSYLLGAKINDGDYFRYGISATGNNRSIRCREICQRSSNYIWNGSSINCYPCNNLNDSTSFVNIKRHSLCALPRTITIRNCHHYGKLILCY